MKLSPAMRARGEDYCHNTESDCLDNKKDSTLKLVSIKPEYNNDCVGKQSIEELW